MTELHCRALHGKTSAVQIQLMHGREQGAHLSRPVRACFLHREQHATNWSSKGSLESTPWVLMTGLMPSGIEAALKIIQNSVGAQSVSEWPQGRQDIPPGPRQHQLR